MSKSIWHTATEKPEVSRYYLEEYEKSSNEVGYLINKRYGNVNTIDDLTTKRWCYLDDLLALETKLDRTRKALDMSLDWLGQVATPAKCDDELCREFTSKKLVEIKKALEQKD